MVRLLLLLCVSCTACTSLRATLPPPSASPARLSPDSEAQRWHIELELVWEQQVGPQGLITFVVDGTTRAVSQLARFSQRLYGQLTQGLARRCPVRCLASAWRIVVQEVQPNVVVIAQGTEGADGLAVVGVYYLGERSDYGLTVLSQLAADRLTAALLGSQARPSAS